MEAMLMIGENLKALGGLHCLWGIGELKIPLAYLPERVETVVVEIVGGKCFVRRFYELGFHP